MTPREYAEQHPEFLPCRGLFGHRWVADTARKALVVEKNTVTISAECATCKMERHDTISLKTGDIDSRSYKAPTGYRIKYGDDEKVIGKAAFRKEAVTGLVNGKRSTAS